MLGPIPLLRQLDHNTLEEVPGPGETGKPHQWRRGFQTIDLVLRDPQLSVRHGLHEVSYSDEAPSGSTSATSMVRAHRERRVRLEGDLSGTDRGDRFFLSRQAEGSHAALFQATASPGQIHLLITSSPKPMDGNEFYGPGTYPGALLPTDSDLEISPLTFDLSVPESALEEIFASLAAGTANAVALQVAIYVFTSEVDNALREHHHQQDFLLHGAMARAVVLDIRTVYVPAAGVSTIRSTDGEPTAISAPPPAHPLRALVTPLWAIAGILLLLLVLR